MEFYKFYPKLKNHLFFIYYLAVTYIVSLWFVLKEIFMDRRKASDIQHQKGKVAIITGGGRGIGYEVALQLLALEMTVVIAGIYDEQKCGFEALQKIAKDRVHFIECDLSSFNQVRNFVEKFKQLNLPLHLLINNAAVMFSPYRETVDGHQYTWAVNYLSHFLLTHLLLPHLKTSSSVKNPSRIVNVSSILHYPASICFTDIEGRESYSPHFSYGQSKLAMLLFARSLTKHFDEHNISIIANAVHPAITFTGLYKNVWWSQKLSFLLTFILRTPLDGSQTVMHAATSASIAKGGHYYENCQITMPSQEAQSILTQDRLWEFTSKQLDLIQFG